MSKGGKKGECGTFGEKEKETSSKLNALEARGTYCIVQGNLLNALYGDPNRKEVQRGGDICVSIADSLCCVIKTDTTL